MKRYYFFVILFCLCLLIGCNKNIDGTVDKINLQDKAKDAFGLLINDWQDNVELCEVMSNCEYSQYGYYDIDNDEIDELVIFNKKGLAIFKYQDGKVVRINWSPYSVLLENGMIKYYRPGGAPTNERYSFSEFDGVCYKEIESLERYDGNEDGNYDELDLYLHNGNEILNDDWNLLYEKYIQYEEAVLTNTGIIEK